MTLWLQRVSIVSIIVGCVGCAVQTVQPPISAVPNQMRDEIHYLAIRGPHAPAIQVSGDDVARRKDMVGRKAGEAGLGSIYVGAKLGAESENPLGFVLFTALGIAAAPAAAVGGAIYGGTVSDSDEDIQTSVPLMRTALTRTPEHMEGQLLAEMERATGLTGVQWEQVGISASDDELRALGFDVVLDLRMTRIETTTSESQVSLLTRNNAQLTDLDDFRVLATRDYQHFTDPKKFSAWVADDAAPLFETLERTFGEITGELIDDFFVDSSIRVNGLEPVAADALRSGRIDSLKPLMLWTATDGNTAVPKGYPIEYELMLYSGSTAPEEGVRLSRDRYVPEGLLESCTRYRWKVRAHYTSFGQPATSPWSPEYRFGTPCD